MIIIRSLEANFLTELAVKFLSGLKCALEWWNLISNPSKTSVTAVRFAAPSLKRNIGSIYPPLKPSFRGGVIGKIV